MANGIVNLSTNTFDEQVLGADKPVVVDFWAEWCGPCKMIAPVLEEIAGEHAEQVTIAKVNVDDNPELAQRYNVMSIPTLLVFSGGEVSKRLVGAKGKAPAAAGARRIPRFRPLTPGQHGRGHPRPPASPRRRRLPPGRRRHRARSAPRPSGAVRGFQQRRGLREHGAVATRRPGSRSSRRPGGSATGRSSSSLRTCAATTSPSCRAARPARVRLRAASTASSARSRLRALEDFQRNCGLDADGVCGPMTARALDDQQRPDRIGPGVATIREIERLGHVGSSLP